VRLFPHFNFAKISSVGQVSEATTKTFASSADGAPSLDLRDWGTVPSSHKAKFRELETRGYLSLAGVGDAKEKTKAGYEILEEKTVPAYAPDECAFLAHHCTECQGVLALVYARNERVSAALGLVSNYEDLKAALHDEIARIPGLEKQAKQLREQVGGANAFLSSATVMWKFTTSPLHI
jgi:hypothetical protein